LKPMPGKCPQCGARTYLARTTIQTDLVEIQNIPCTVCQECGQEQIGQLAQRKTDKLLERAAKGNLKTRTVVM
jgi:YgiT-type zinc finger domain-containing protein